MSEKKMDTIIICAHHTRPLLAEGLAALLQEYTVLPCETLDQMDFSNPPSLLVMCAPSTHCMHVKERKSCQTSKENNIPVLFVSEGWLESEEAVRKAELNGYLGPGCSPKHFVEATKVVLEGGIFYHPGSRSNRTVGPLTTRQVQVMELVGSSYSDQEIASCLGIAETTVRHHLETLLHKLNLERRGELSTLAVLGGLHGQLKRGFTSRAWEYQYGG